LLEVLPQETLSTSSMTLSDIETTLGELAVRHENLDAQLLETLLRAAGWEDKTIKEALVLFKTFDVKKWVREHPTPTPIEIKTISSVTTSDNVAQRIVEPPTVYTPVVEEKSPPVAPQNDPIVFYQPDGTEERDLHMLTQEQMNSPVKRTQEVVHVSQIDLPLQDKHELVVSVDSITATHDDQLPVAQDVVENTEQPHVRENVYHVDVGDIKRQEINVSASEIKTSNIITPVTYVAKEYAQAIFENEPESLIVPQESISKIAKEVAIPENLPLLPFESSPHIWSFSRYKNVFHSADKKIEPEPIPEEIKVISVMPQEKVQEVQQVLLTVIKQPEPTKPQVNIEENEEVSLEKVPMTKGDESLVFLAGVMLLVIILILGYMYSNGRL